MTISYPTTLIEKLRNLEKEAPHYSGAEIANAISYSHWGDRPKYINIFFYKPDETLRGLIEKHNLKSPRENDGLEPTDSRFHENIYDTREIIWLHFISSFSAYLT